MQKRANGNERFAHYGRRKIRHRGGGERPASSLALVRRQPICQPSCRFSKEAWRRRGAGQRLAASRFSSGGSSVLTTWQPGNLAIEAGDQPERRPGPGGPGVSTSSDHTAPKSQGPGTQVCLPCLLGPVHPRGTHGIRGRGESVCKWIMARGRAAGRRCMGTWRADETHSVDGDQRRTSDRTGRETGSAPQPEPVISFARSSQ